MLGVSGRPSATSCQTISQAAVLIFEQSVDHPVIEVFERVSAHYARKPFGDQLFGHAAFERIESFNLAGLDGRTHGSVRRATLR